MKYLRLIPLLLLASCAAQRPLPHFSAPSSAPVHQAIHQTANKIASAQVHAAAAKAAVTLDAARTEIDALSQDLLDAQAAATAAETRVSELDKKNAEIVDFANAKIDAANKAIIAREAAEHRYHHIKLILCFLGAAAAGLLLFQFRWVLALLGPWGMLGYAAVPAAVFGILWMWL